MRRTNTHATGYSSESAGVTLAHQYLMVGNATVLARTVPPACGVKPDGAGKPCHRRLRGCATDHMRTAKAVRGDVCVGPQVSREKRHGDPNVIRSTADTKAKVLVLGTACGNVPGVVTAHGRKCVGVMVHVPLPTSEGCRKVSYPNEGNTYPGCVT